MITLGLLEVALPRSLQPGASATWRDDEREVAIHRLAVPLALAS